MSESGGSQNQHWGDDIQSERGPRSGSQPRGPGPERHAQKPGPLCLQGGPGLALNQGEGAGGLYLAPRPRPRWSFVLG